jgi:hypothetical protein
MSYPSTLERVANCVQNMTIIFCVFTGLITLFISQHDKRVQSTLTFRTDFASGVRSDYSKLINNYNKSVPDPRKITEAGGQQQEEIVEAFFMKDENKNLLNNIADFFDSLQACIEYRACDQNTAGYLFKSPALQVYESFGYYIDKARKSYHQPEFAAWLQSIAHLKAENTILSYL